MPLYEHVCPECGARRDVYAPVAADKGAETVLCSCGSSMGPLVSWGQGLTWFEEGRPRVIEHLGDQPVVVRSHREYTNALKKAGVEWATGWKTKGTGGWV